MQATTTKQSPTQAPSLLPPPAEPVEVPTTSAGLDALGARRAELSRQLQTLTDRREELTDQVDETPLANRADLETRIKLVDDRSLMLERELAATDDAISGALASGVTWSDRVEQQTATVVSRQNDELEYAVQSAAEDAVFGAIATAGAVVVGVWVLWRGFRRFVLRRKRAATPAIVDPNPRLDQLQASIDVIALEMERVSEAQRFVAKVLNEKVPAVGSGGSSGVASTARSDR